MWVRPAGGKMVGSMDLGGASTQIAFTLPDPNARGTDIMRVTLYGYEYNIYTHSFLCYGKNEAEKRVLAALVKVLCKGNLGLLQIVFVFFQIPDWSCLEC